MTGAKHALRHAHKMKCGQGGHLIHKFSSLDRIDAIVSKCRALSTVKQITTQSKRPSGLRYAIRPLTGATAASEVRPWVFW